MDTENCTNLYIQTCQTYISCNYDDPQSFEDLYRLLPWLRQSLSCCICSKVLQEPMSSTQSHCQHFICKNCRGGKMILRPSCGWCKDQDVFVVNEQLVVLVSCFKKICELISRSPISKHIQAYDKEILQMKKMTSLKVESSNVSPVKKKKNLKIDKTREPADSIINISVGQVLEDAMNIP